MSDKNQLWSNSWVIRGLSLLFTLFLFISVKAENSSNNRASNLSTSMETSITLDQVAVELGQADKDMYVTGLPETVSVTLTGPRNILTQLNAASLIVKTENLTKLKTGEHSVKLLIDNLPQTVTYEVTPSHVTVQIDQKQTQTFDIEYDLADNLIADGYQVTAIHLDPEQITLSGPQATIAKVERVFISITADQAQTKSFKNIYPLQIVDAQGELLDISADISTVTAQVELATTTKTVKLQIVPQGEYRDIFTYHYTFAGNDQVTISGEADVIAHINTLNVAVDVSNLTQSGKLSGTIQVPERISVNSGNQVDVIVTVSPLTVNSDSTTQSTTSPTDTSTTEVTE